MTPFPAHSIFCKSSRREYVQPICLDGSPTRRVNSSRAPTALMSRRLDHHYFQSVPLPSLTGNYTIHHSAKSGDRRRNRQSCDNIDSRSRLIVRTSGRDTWQMFEMIYTVSFPLFWNVSNKPAERINHVHGIVITITIDCIFIMLNLSQVSKAFRKAGWGGLEGRILFDRAPQMSGPVRIARCYRKGMVEGK